MEPGVIIGEDVIIREFAIIRAGAKLGDRVHIGNYAVLWGGPVIGDGTHIGPFACIGDGTVIGKDCFIGPQSGIYNRRYPFAKNPAYRKVEGVEIGDRVIAGAQCLFVPGVKVGHDSFIAAKALITKDVPPYSIVMGFPAKVVGDTRTLEAYK